MSIALEEPVQTTIIYCILSFLYILLSVVIAYFMLTKIAKVFVRSEIERVENDKLLQMINEGLLIVTNETKQKIMFSNRNFLQYLLFKEDEEL